MPRRSLYGLALGPHDETYAEWVVEERARARAAMKRHRAKRRAQLGGEPDYPHVLRDAMVRWINAHRAGLAEADLAAVVHYMRKAVRIEYPELYDAIQDRGTAKLLRTQGFVLTRQAQGLVVRGLRV